MKTYRRKPLVIKAIQYNGDNFKEVVEFCPSVTVAGKYGNEGDIVVRTDEGDITICIGDYVFNPCSNHFYQCNQTEFEILYELTEQENTNENRTK